MNTSDGRMRRALLAAAVSGGVTFLVIFLVGRVRIMDRDEGFYAMAADLVRAGRMPWRDFVYTQGPLLPVLLALVGADVYGLRWTSALCAAVLVAVLALHVARRYSARTAVCTAAVIVTSGYFVSWMSTLKTYAPAGMLIVAATVTVAWRSTPRCRGARSVAAGVLVGLSGLIRIPHLALLVPLALWITSGRAAIRDALLLVGSGVAVFLAGCVASGASVDQMLFNGVTVHTLTPVDDPWQQRLDTLREVFSDVHCVALVAAGLLCAARRAPGIPLRERDHALAAMLAFVLTVGFLLGRPTWAQYFTVAVPFWAWSAVPLWDWLVRPPAGARAPALAVLAVCLAATFVLYAPRIVVSPFPYQTWFSVREVEATREYLRSHLAPGSEVSSTWPGYVAGTGHRPTLGLESTVAFDVVDDLSPAMREQVRVMGLTELYAHIDAGRPDAVVINSEDVVWWSLRPELMGRYARVFTSGSVTVLARRREHE